MIQIFKEFFTLDNFFKLLLVIIPSVITYFITKYNVQKPTKIQTKKAQFEKVYLPLYKLTYNKSEKTPTDELNQIAVQINKIIEKNFEFVFPGMQSLVDDLLEALKEPHKKVKNLYYREIATELFHQINYDYEILKKQLGYPCKGTWQSFKRMVASKKIVFILVRVFTVLAILLALYTTVLLLLAPQTFTIKLIICIIAFFAQTVLMNYLYKKNLLS